MGAIFSRYTPSTDRTFALRAFNKCETEINEHFWSFKVISDFSRFLAEQEKIKDPRASTAKVFSASGPNARRIPPTVSDWLNARKELENWLRLSALTSAASYFEVYLRQVIRTALMSDPMCRYSGGSRKVDGVKFLKTNFEVPVDPEIESVTKGDWSSRCSEFANIFGQVPNVLQANLSKLEKIRKLRNNFAHGFGRKIDTGAPSEFQLDGAERISEPTFLDYIAVLSKVAADIDSFLLHKFVGAFELIYFYHTWNFKPRPVEDKAYDSIRALQRAFNRDAGHSVSPKFCEDLIGYYDTI
jgi:hypothetical protein